MPWHATEIRRPQDLRRAAGLDAAPRIATGYRSLLEWSDEPPAGDALVLVRDPLDLTQVYATGGSAPYRLWVDGGALLGDRLADGARVAHGLSAGTVLGQDRSGLVVRLDLLAPLPLPLISPAGGIVSVETLITITCPYAPAVLHFTTDGTTPTQASPVYGAPFALATTGTRQVQAIAIADGWRDSPVASAAFTVETEWALLFVGTPDASMPGGASSGRYAYGYLFEQNLVASSGGISGNPGTLIPQTAYLAYGAGPSGYALRPTGYFTAQTVDVGFQLAIEDYGGWSVAFWAFRGGSASGTQTGVSIQHMYDVGTSYVQVVWDHPTSGSHLVVYPHPSHGGPVINVIAPVVPENSWVHIVVSRNLLTGTNSVYVGGVLFAEATGAADPSDMPRQLWLSLPVLSPPYTDGRPGVDSMLFFLGVVPDYQAAALAGGARP